MVTFERVDLPRMDWGMSAQIGEMNIFQSAEWLNFLCKKQNLEPIIAAIKKDGRLLGFLYGLIAEKFGLRILGSPFRGWTTYFMGFNLREGVSRHDVMAAFPGFVFHELHCHYLEVIDPNLRASDLVGLPYKVEPLPWFLLDLTPSENELFAGMKHACRTNIRKAIKNNLIIEEAEPTGFAEEYFSQYTDVMTRHALAPAFGRQMVEMMIEHLFPTGNLLLLRARMPDGPSIATGLFLFFGQTAVFWGAASWHEYQCLRPNEYLAWEGIKILKSRGVQVLHFGGYADQYKEKLGCQDANLVRVMLASNSILGHLVNFASSPKSERYRNWMLRRL
ncbi:MAG: GNAT family N-acetyltransferase [Anaerolineales bacterium]